MTDKPRNYLCLECVKHITPGDDDGLCPDCGSYELFSYTDEDIDYTSPAEKRRDDYEAHCDRMIDEMRDEGTQSER